VLRRWWLVLLVAMVVGGGGILAANRLVAPTYEAEALVLYVSVQAAQQHNVWRWPAIRRTSCGRTWNC
jgi:uncharacterized protein involved in exopolysaccharide biosynthesis